jgi:molecular chaperone GrpE (heat shock protein)
MSDRRDAPVGGSLPGPANGASDGQDRAGSTPGRNDHLVGDRSSDQGAFAGDAEPSTEGPAVTELLLPDTAALIVERDEYLGALQRMKADFDNYRKRIVRQQEEQSARAAQALVAKLLPVLDTLDLAQAHLASGSRAEGSHAAGRAPGPTGSAGQPGGGGAPATATVQRHPGVGPFGSAVDAAQSGRHAAGPSGSRGPGGQPPVSASAGQARPELTALSQARSQLLDVLVKEGLERVDKTDVPFDPEVHDAVAQAAAEPGQAGALVDEVMRAGYRWRGQVVRPAMVRVRG